MDNKDKILSVINLNKYFVKSGKFVQVLKDINFDVYKNDFFGIIGESGSGKSTTGKCIIRLYDSSSGIIEFDNKIINQKLTKNNKKWLTKNMSMVFQDPMSSLNPKKTILSIVSEPLVINKVIKKDIKEIIKTSLKINSYFKLTYKKQDYELTNKYLLTFYKSGIELFQTYVDFIMKYIDNSTNDPKLIVLNFLMCLNELESQYKLLIPNIYTYNKSIADLLWINNEKLITNNLTKQEHDYYVYKEEYEQNKLLNDFSKEFLQLKDTKEELEKTLNEMLDSIKTKYVFQNKDFLNSLISNLKSEIKINKQNKQLSSSITEYNILKIKIMISKEMLESINLIINEKFYSKNDLDMFLDYLFSRIKNKYDDVLGLILTISHLSNEIDTLSIDNNSSDDIKKVISEYHLQYNNLQEQIKQLEDSKKVYEYEDILELKNKFVNECNNIKHKKQQIVDFYSLTIENINKKLERLEKEYKTSNEYLNNQKLIEKSKKKLLNAKQERDELIENDTNEFNKVWLPLINEQKQEINKSRKTFFRLQKKYKSIVNKKTNEIIKQIKQINDISKSDKKYWIDFLKKEIKAKFVNIQAINFELSTYLDEIDTYRSIRTSSLIKLNLYRIPLKNIITRKYVYNALNEVGLKNEHAYRYPHEFSGGQRQRIVIARALIMKPKLVIADEPISALDVSIQAQVINIMKRLSNEQGITFLFIAHDLSMVHHISNRLIIMHKGRIVEKGDTNEIFANPIHPYTKSLIKASPELSKIHVDLASFSTKLDYDKDYENNYETLKFYSVSDKKEHFVLATKEQFELWTHQKK